VAVNCPGALVLGGLSTKVRGWRSRPLDTVYGGTNGSAIQGKSLQERIPAVAAVQPAIIIKPEIFVQINKLQFRTSNLSPILESPLAPRRATCSFQPRGEATDAPD